eukprot:SRR837773.3798.p2 GENE.SRR837773.3798~~SRR837773.3798.p2  ORF type:complete len:185 (-),score=40.67 SRR837773.3798:69-623(-)
MTRARLAQGSWPSSSRQRLSASSPAASPCSMIMPGSAPMACCPRCSRRMVLVMFAEGSLQSEQQLSVIYHSVEAQKPLVPVILPGFKFPLPSFRCSARVDDEGTTREAHLHLKAVFKIIAVALPSHGSLKSLSAQAENLIARIPKDKTLQKYASLAGGQDDGGAIQAGQDHLMDSEFGHDFREL